MVEPGKDPQDQQSVANSVREKLNRFYSELSDDERAYVEARMKQAVTSAATPAETRLGIEAPVNLVINHSNKALVVTNIELSGGPDTPLFDGASPKVGDIIEPGNSYGFTWIEWFFGSDCRISLQAQDGSGTVRTSVGMNFISGWGYGCDSPTGSLACGDNGTNPDSWDNNVEVINS
jgi:hypothetical protein